MKDYTGILSLRSSHSPSAYIRFSIRIFVPQKPLDLRRLPITILVGSINSKTKAPKEIIPLEQLPLLSWYVLLIATYSFILYYPFPVESKGKIIGVAIGILVGIHVSSDIF